MPIPPDNRAPGDPGHITDHHDISDELTALVAADAAETARALAAEALLAPLASPALTGTPTAPTQTAGNNSTRLATTAYADAATAAEAAARAAADALLAPLASPALTGSPTAPTQTAGDSSTKIATDAFVAAAVAAARPLATENTYFVSAATSASDSNDGLTVKTAKATIAGALTAAGSAAARIIVGAGTFTISAADGNGNAVTLPNAGMILQGQGTDRTVINVSTTVTWGILAQAAYCEVRDLAVQATTGGTVTYGAGVDTPSSPGSAEHCAFRDILVQPVSSGVITNCFAVAPAHTGASNIDVAETVFLRCIGLGAANAGYLLGNGTVGNILNTTLTDCYSSSSAYGVYATGTTFSWAGGTVQKSSTADFYLSSTKRADIGGFRSENSARFLVSPAAGGTNNVAVRDVIWIGGDGLSGRPSQAAAGDWINYAQAGSLLLENVQIQAVLSSGVVPCFILASGGGGVSPLAVTAINLSAEALPHQLFSIASGKPCAVLMQGYVQLSNSTGYAVDSVPPQGPLVLKPFGQLFTFNGTSRQVMTPESLPRVFSPRAFGGIGDGATDDTTAVTAAFTAAAAVKGTVDLGTYVFKTTAAVALASNVTVCAASQQAGLTNSASDLFTVTGTVTNVTIRDCSLTASAGHVFNCATGSSTSFWRIVNAALTQAGNGFSIWSMLNGTYLDMLVGDGCILSCAAGATVAPWKIISTNNSANTNTWRRLRALANGAAVPFFHVENQAAGGYCSDNVFREITAEVCTGGIINALSVAYLSVEAVAGFDVTTYSGTLFNIGTGSGSNRSGFIHIKNSGRRGGTLGSGVFDVAAASNVVSVILENVGPLSGSGTYSVPSAQTVIIAPSSASASDPLALGIVVNFLPGMSAAATAFAANLATFSRVLAGGYAISNLNVNVTTSSGNISVGTYTNSGSGNSQAPTGGRTATSGAIACPATGVSAISLGATVTPALGDWVGLSADNATAAIMASGNSLTLGLVSSYFSVIQTSAHPVPSTPSGLTNSATRYYLVRGS